MVVIHNKYYGLGISLAGVVFYAISISLFALLTMPLASASNVSAPSPRSCPEIPEVNTFLSEDAWLEIRDSLGPNLSLCLNNSRYFALYGAALMHTSMLSQSIEMLERALLLAPNNGGALLDYSTALYRSGELGAAIEINSMLLGRSDLPGYLRPILEEREKNWKAERIRWSGRFAVLGGYHDNLNGVADLEQLTLTLDGEDLIVFLGENSIPIAGNYVSSRLETLRVQRMPDGASRFAITLQNRSTELHRVDTDELSMSYDRELLMDERTRNWGASMNYLRYGGEELYLSFAGRIAQFWNSGGCSPYVDGRLRTLKFPSQTHLDEASIGFGAGTRCGSPENQLTIGATLSYNRSLDGRAGDDRLGGEISMKWQVMLGSGIAFTQLSYGMYTDQDGYSPLLNNNAERVNESISFSAQYIYPLSERFSLHAGYYYRQQDSNIELFETTSTNADLGFSVSF